VRLFPLGSVVKITEADQIFGATFSTVKRIAYIFNKIGWATFWVFFS
jgi:hypothetical protein